MLFDLGGVTFVIAGPNIDKVSLESKADFATYNVVGAEPKYEFMGEGARTIKLSGKILPRHFGGYSALDALNAIRASGQPVSLVRGDGRSMGWVIIDEIEEKHSWLLYNGSPQSVEHEIKLTRIDAPSVGSVVGFFFSLF